MTGFTATPTIWAFMNDPAYVRVLAGPVGCLAGDALVVTAQGPQRIDSLTQPTRVLSWDASKGRFRFVLASASFPKGTDALYRVLTPHGEWRAAGHHRVLCADGKYRLVRELDLQDPSSALARCAGLPATRSVVSLRWLRAGARRLMRTIAGWMGRCGWLSRRCGLQPPRGLVGDLALSPSQLGALVHAAFCSQEAHTHRGQPFGPPSTPGFATQAATLDSVAGGAGYAATLYEHAEEAHRGFQRSLWRFWCRLTGRRLTDRTGSYAYSVTERPILGLTRELTQEVYWDLQVPGTNNYVTADGAIHHNSGKSIGCCHEIVRLALLQAPNQDGVRKTRALIVRNTVDQLKSTVMKSWFDWFPAGVWGHYKASDKTFYMKHALPDGTHLDAEVCFSALDDPADVRKVLSLELTFLWCNEWRELRPEVVDGLLMRLKRYPSMKDGGPTRSCAIFDTNMPDQDTWHHQQMEDSPSNWSVHIQPPAILNFEEFYNQEGAEPTPEDGVEDPRGVSWWVNPKADNTNNLDSGYYPDIIPGKSEDFINVYLRCRYGRSLAGLPVYEKSFSREFHVAKEPFTAIRSEKYPLIVGLDFGRTPSAVIGQRNVTGQLVILVELSSTNMGIETFLSQKLIPRLAEPDLAGCPVVVAPDPAGFAKQQVGEHSPADAVAQAGLRLVRPLTNDPDRRIEAVERLLLNHVNGKPMLVINPACTDLIKGFAYGYKYRLNKQGVQDDKPLKDQHSHLADACQYFCLVADSGMQGLTPRQSREARNIKPARAAGWT